MNKDRKRERGRVGREGREGEWGEWGRGREERKREWDDGMLKLLTGVVWMQLWRVECMWTAGGTYLCVTCAIHMWNVLCTCLDCKGLLVCGLYVNCMSIVPVDCELFVDCTIYRLYRRLCGDEVWSVIEFCVDSMWIVERMEIKCRWRIHCMQSVFYKSYMDCILIVCGLFLECVWIVCRWTVDYEKLIHRLYENQFNVYCTWTMFVLYMDCGVYMDCVWIVCGLSVEMNCGLWVDWLQNACK